MKRLLQKIVSVRDEEIASTLWAAFFSFCLLASWYILRPVREEIGSNHRDVLSKLWTGTFFVMLAVVPVYSAIVSRFPRRIFIPIVYRFFLVSILLFFALLQVLEGTSKDWTEYAYYMWMSVFALFVPTVFWGFMADIFRNEQGKRLFGFIAGGGTLGAIAGSELVAQLATELSPIYLLLLSAALLEAATQAMKILARRQADVAPTAESRAAGEQRIRGGVLSGLLAVFQSPYLLGICLYIFFMTHSSTFIYFLQADIVADAFESRAERTAFFARINLWVNVAALGVQVLMIGRLVAWLGVGATLIVLPLFSMLGYSGLALAPTLTMLVFFNVLSRMGRFAFSKPAREMLFTVVSREAKYKSKAFVDTVVYRGGDMANAWVFEGLKTAFGGSQSLLAWSVVPVGIVWAAVAWILGRKQEKLALREAET